MFYCGDLQTSKLIVHQLITDSGFVGVDAGRLPLAKEVEAPDRMNRARFHRYLVLNEMGQQSSLPNICWEI